jgi:hypothetical protein
LELYFTTFSAQYVVFILGKGLIGYNPYILNFSTHGNPFWPLYGENTVDIISGNTPEYLAGKPPFEKFISLFLLETNWKNMPFNPLKLILLVKSGYDLRIGGFGVFFIELFLGCLLVLFISVRKKGISQFEFIQNRGESSNPRKILRPSINFPADDDAAPFSAGAIVFTVFVLAGLVIVTPENWWARYIPFFWYVPFFCVLPVDISRLKKLFFCIGVIVCINSGAFLGLNAINGIEYTQNINKFVKEVENTPNDNITVVVSVDYFKYSVEEKLNRHGIKKNVSFIEDKDTIEQFTQVIPMIIP